MEESDIKRIRGLLDKRDFGACLMAYHIETAAKMLDKNHGESFWLLAPYRDRCLISSAWLALAGEEAARLRTSLGELCEFSALIDFNIVHVFEKLGQYPAEKINDALELLSAVAGENCQSLRTLALAEERPREGETARGLIWSLLRVVSVDLAPINKKRGTDLEGISNIVLDKQVAACARVVVE